MYRRTIQIGTPLAAGSLHFAESRNSVLAATTDGRVVAVRLFDGAVDDVGADYVDPVGVVPLADGLRLAIAEADGAILVVGLHAADRQYARVLAQYPGPILGVAEHPDFGALLVLSYSPDTDAAQVSQCDVDSGDITVLANIDAGFRIAVDPVRRCAIVLSVLAGKTRQLTTVGLDDGAVDTVDTEAYDHIVAAPGGAVFATRPDSTSPTTDVLALRDGTETSVEPLPFRVDGLTRWGSLVLVASGTELHAVEWDMAEGALPVAAPLGPLSISGYTRLQVDLPALGLGVGDVVYEVLEGADYGSISLGVEPPNADGTESVMVLAGLTAGEFHVVAVSVADGSWLATRRIRVTTLWPDPVNGPPIAVTGEVGATLMDWGGAGGLAGYRFPAPPEKWRILVVLLYLKDRKFDDENASRNKWKDRVVGGGESVRRFYEEVSAYAPGDHGMTVELVGGQVYGPVFVNRGWGDVFKTIGGVNDGWLSTDAGSEALANAVSGFFADMAGGDVLIASAHSVVFVIRCGSLAPVSTGSGNPDLPTKFVWGSARPDVAFWRKTSSPSTPPTIPTTFTQFQRPVTFITDEVPLGSSNRYVTRTLCHEIGHNLGLDDLYDADGDYPAEINARSIGALDLMGTSQRLPHFSLANRVALGWIDQNWLRRFDFTVSPAGGSVTLQAIETVGAGGPTNGRVAGIEVPISGAWSYLFEYRREQPRQIGDKNLNPAVIGDGYELIAGTDLRDRGGEVARPPILRLPKDADGDGPVLNFNTEDFQDSDTTNPQRMHDFILTLDDIRSPDNDSAEVTVEYLAAHRPQLVVHPAPGNGDFKSDDIKLVGPGGKEVPVVKGAPNNTIEITVHNVGSLDATNAKIHVKWMPFGLTPGEWKSLPDPDPFDVSANNKTTVTVLWDVPGSVPVAPGGVEATHFCVRVDIDRYEDLAHPEKSEIVVWDNWAQSNFDTTGVGRGSPSDRLATAVTATNTLDRTATYRFAVRQDTAWYRVYLGHAWLRLAPDETRAIPLAYESLAGDPLYGDQFDDNIETIYKEEHHVSIASSVVPENTECGTPRRVFGCGLTLRAGHKVVIDEIGYNDEVIFARVSTVRAGALEPLTSGLLHLAAWPDDDPGTIDTESGSVSNGRGAVAMPARTLQDLRNGRPVSFVLAVPAEGDHIAAVTVPATLNR